MNLFISKFEENITNYCKIFNRRTLKNTQLLKHQLTAPAQEILLSGYQLQRLEIFGREKRVLPFANIAHYAAPYPHFVEIKDFRILLGRDQALNQAELHRFRSMLTNDFMRSWEILRSIYLHPFFKQVGIDQVVFKVSLNGLYDDLRELFVQGGGEIRPNEKFNAKQFAYRASLKKGRLVIERNKDEDFTPRLFNLIGHHNAIVSVGRAEQSKQNISVEFMYYDSATTSDNYLKNEIRKTITDCMKNWHIEGDICSIDLGL